MPGPSAAPPATARPGEQEPPRPRHARPPAAPSARRNGLAARLDGRGGKLRLRVSAPAAGRVVVSGPSVQPLRRRVARPGSYVLRPLLKPAARKALNRRGRLKVRVKVRFLPREGRATARTITAEVTR